MVDKLSGDEVSISDEQTAALLSQMIEMRADVKDLRRELDSQREESERRRRATEKTITQLQADVSFIKQQASRWKGLFLGLLGGGTFIGWLLSEIDSIRSFFRGH